MGEATASVKEQRRFYTRIWWPLFVTLQIVAVGVITEIEPEGFDRCTAAPSAADQRTQGIVAALSLVIPLAVALGWLHWRYLLACAAVVVLPAWFWLVMLGPGQVC